MLPPHNASSATFAFKSAVKRRHFVIFAILLLGGIRLKLLCWFPGPAQNAPEGLGVFIPEQTWTNFPYAIKTKKWRFPGRVPKTAIKQFGLS